MQCDYLQVAGDPRVPEYTQSCSIHHRKIAAVSPQRSNSKNTRQFGARIGALVVGAQIILIILSILGLTACTRSNGRILDDQGEWKGATVMIGLDGMRWDFPEAFSLHALSGIADAGVRADALIPVFPTKTFPNFYTLATGLFPNHTGILDNTMYDPTFDARFRMGDTSAVRDGRWWEGEPVWVTAEKQNKRAAVYFWPGSEAEISGRRPTFSMPYDGSVPNDERVEQAFRWLSLPAGQRPSLILLYFSTVDDAGHRHGPDAPETAAAAREIDSLIGKLWSELIRRGFGDTVNLVIVSDHGFSARSSDRVVYLDDFVDLRSAGILSLGQHVTLWPKPEAVDSVYFALADAHPELKVYKRENLPPRLHLAGHRRTPPIIAVPSAGWTVSTRRTDQRPQRFSGGAHGYDNIERDMRGVFIAGGPAFRTGVRIDSLRAVDVYNVVVRSIGIEPASNDGDASIVPRLMVNHDAK